MSQQYNGKPGNVTLPAVVNINSSQHTTPIIVRAVAHGLTTGDVVDITGHQANYTANGENPVTVIDADHFSIPVAGVAVGSGTGTVQSRACGQTAAIPSDGDDTTGASVDVMFETLADRTALLEQNTGAVRVLSFADVQIQDDNATEQTNWLGSSFTFGSQNTWVQVAGIASPPQGILQAGDVIDYELRFSVQWADGATTGIGFMLGLGVGYSVAGTLPGSSVKVPCSGLVVPDTAANGGRSGMVLRGRVTVPLLSSHQTAEFFLYAYTRSASFASISFTCPGDAQAIITVYRPTGAAQ